MAGLAQERLGGRLFPLSSAKQTLSLPGAILAALRSVALGIIVFSGAPAAAQTVPAPPGGGFSNPVDCRIGEDCWVLNYPDMAAGADVRDPHCKHRTYDTHKGTDIAIPDLAAMRRGVAVLSAADGVVLRRRNSVVDQIIWTDALRARTKGKECGNGIVIDHGAGWEGQYCHLRRGSIVVRPGDTVVRGQKIGRIGASGLTAFPHVHLTLRYKGKVIDPLTGRFTSQGCGKPARLLWSDKDLAAYQGTQLYAVGMTDGAVTKRQLKEDASTAASLPGNAPALVLWAALFGTAKGDQLRLEITGPDGTVIRRTDHTINRSQAWRMLFSGFRRRGETWPPGTYKGRVTVNRVGDIDPATQVRTVTIDIRP